MSQLNPSSLKVISFDLDDTLWPCFPTIIKAEQLLHQWLSENVPAITERYDLYQMKDKRHAFLGSHPELAHDLTRLRIKSLEQLADEFGLTEEWIQPAFEVFYAARQQVTLFDDVAPVLDELKRSFRLVSLTNGNASPSETGVAHWFDFSLNAAGVGKLKSEPDIYQQVQEKAGISASEMLHIGDDPINDIAGAKSAGVATIWLNRENKAWEHDTCEPDAEINSLHELPSLLK